MTLVELRYLLAVAAERHFGRAARACHVSQPALSGAIKNLEEELGALLFDREGGVRLTTVGEQVVAQARRVLDEAGQLTRIAAEKPAPLATRLRLGAIATLAPFVLTPLIVPLLRAHPRLDLVLREGLTEDLLGLLRLGELDAVLLALPAQGAGLAAEPLFSEPFVALLSARSPLAKKRALSVADLAAEKLILLTEGHCFRDQALEVCRGHLAFEEPSRDQLAATSLHTIWRMVESGLGCTLAPQLAVDDLERGGRARVISKPLGRPVPARTVGVVWRADSPATADARALAAFVRAHLPKTVTAVPTVGPVG